MKTEKKNRTERLEFFSALYENAKNAYAEELNLMERHMKQYRGSTELDGAKECATTVRNITYELIESQISSDIPQPKCDPAIYSEKRCRSAHAVETLCKSLRDALPFEELNDLDERYTYIYGGSIWFVEWDAKGRCRGEDGGVKVHCLSPRDFIPQPGVSSVEDMEYCFLRLKTTAGELSRKYGVRDEDISLADFEYETVKEETDTVSVVLVFYKDEAGDICRYDFSGDLVLLDMEKYYKRKTRFCKRCSHTAAECSCEKPLLHHVDVDEEEISDKDRGVSMKVPYYLPSDFPFVIRKNTSVEGCLLGQSDCEYIRPEQQAINKIESRILQKLLRAGITPIVPEDASITLNNSVFGQLIKMKPGESAAQYGKVDTTPDISQDIAEAERLYDHSKRIVGISDAYQGIDSASNESGVARRLRISQASGRLESKRRMKHTAYSHLDRKIFEHYLAFSDEVRLLSYKDAFGRIHNAAFNRYDFIEYDPDTGKFRYDDAYLFSVDQNGGADYQRDALWERNLENLKAGTLGDPTRISTLLRYWQCQERAHYPHARENVEYFTELLRKGDDIGAEGKDPQAFGKEPSEVI